MPALFIPAAFQTRSIRAAFPHPSQEELPSAQELAGAAQGALHTLTAALAVHHTAPAAWQKELGLYGNGRTMQQVTYQIILKC